MQNGQTNSIESHNDIIGRKCNAVFIFWGMIFFIVLLFMFICLFTLDLGYQGSFSLVSFFFLVELVVAIMEFEEYVNILIIGKDGITFENGILVKNKKEISYDKINSVNIVSAFGFGHLEIITSNDTITRYKFLNNYKEIEKEIKTHIHNKK